MRYKLVFGLALPLILFAACSRASDTASTSSTAAGATTVQVNESDYKIVSSLTIFAPGKSYHFVVTNNGGTTHEFMIMPKPEGSMGGMSMNNMDTMALAKVEGIGPGQTATLDYTFLASARGSHPELTCYYPGHYEAGMKQGVSVNS